VSTVGILQARMSSSRLPGKVLLPVGEEPMVGRQIDRLARVRGIDNLVVATSDDASDDLLVEYLESRGVPVVRGSLNDVLDRFITVLDEFGPESVVRLTADCPLVSPAVADQVISEFHASGADYASNTLQPTFPDGLDVEVVKADVLRWVAANSTDPHEREHVTLGVYRRPERFSLLNVRGSSDFSDLRWTVDNSDDLEFVRSVYSRLYLENPEFEFEDVLSLLRAEPSLSRTNRDAGRNVALDGLDTGAMER
jgi:spore coat polysaccharide biosynthesis protein SpsF